MNEISELITIVKENTNSIKALADYCKQNEIIKKQYETEIYSLQQEIESLRNALKNNNIYAVAAPRANKSVTHKIGAAKISVRDASICVSAGAYVLIQDRNYKYVQFYATDVAHVVAIKFIETESPESVPLTQQKLMNGGLGNHMINSTFAVRSVFGAVNPGSPTRYYNACLLEGTDDTILVWPDTEDFCLNGQKAKLTDIYLVSMKSNQKRVTVINGRVRLTQGALNTIGYTGGNLFAKITGNEIVFSSKPKKDYFQLTASHYGSGVGSMEICSVAACKMLGYDKTSMKSIIYDIQKTVSGIKLILNKVNMR